MSLSKHWVLFYVDTKEKKISWLDPIASSRIRSYNVEKDIILQWFTTLLLPKLGYVDAKEWPFLVRNDIPEQKKGVWFAVITLQPESVTGRLPPLRVIAITAPQRGLGILLAFHLLFHFFALIKLPSLPRFPSREREQGVLVKEGTRPTLSALGVAAVASISRIAVALPVLSLLLVRGHEQVPIGSAEVRAVFSSGSGRVAGCMVTEGKIVDGCGIRVIRNGCTVHVSVLDSLRRVKEIVKEVNAGLECAMGVEDYDQWQEGDILEAFNTVQKKRTLEEASTSMAATLEEVGVEL
ncbi:uncharacterized protein LOC128039825 [Gossypium raimondii]|uniref:uncharacterized protein LOC128039825 n=1 Tax=Gossypium raimondii TaxID=29730 RepID=UPI00227B3925|nr:uncharacterized protein LOC128039825 [Gossypium raimondii]